VIIPLKRTAMIGDLFDSPFKILIVAVVLIVLFGSAKLPVAARSLGKSMRILKTEMKSFHEDDPEPGSAAPALAGTQQLPTAQQLAAQELAAQELAAQELAAQELAGQPQLAAQRAQRRIDDLQQQIADLKAPAEGQPAAQRTLQPE
jgi:sec-independent protein translocase protein TatA